MNGKDARVNLVKSFYATCRTNGMTASRALEFARARAKRYAEEIEQLPFGRERSALHKSLWPKARPSICAAIRQSIKSEVHTWQSNKAQAFKLVAGLYYSPDSRAERWRELWAVFAESAGIKTPKRA